MFKYAQIDNNGYCIGISTLLGKITIENHILLKDENVVLGQKYDLQNKCWLNEFLKEDTSIKDRINLEQLQLQEELEYIKTLLEIQGGIINV